MIPNPIKILLLLIAALSAALAWLWIDQTGHWRNIQWSTPASKVPEFTVPAPLTPPVDPAVAATSYDVILERPLFAPDRRPPPPPAPPAPPPPPDPLADVQIRGIFTGEHTGVLARVNGKARLIRVSESVGSWMLKSIDGRQATFVQGTERRQLQLAYAKLNTVVPPPAASAGQAPSPGAPSTSGGNSAQRAQEETRDRIRRLNEARASRGQPPINYP